MRMKQRVIGIIGISLGLAAQLCQAQPEPASAPLMPGENLIVQGIPPIPRSVPERADRYTEFRSAAVFSWHPQRRELLIGTPFADTRTVHGGKTPGGARPQLTF